MKRTLLSLTFLAFFPSIAVGDELPAEVAQYVDEQTLVVARADLRRLRLTETLQRLGRLAPEVAESPDVLAAAAAADRVRQRLVAAGAGQAWFIASLWDVPQPGPFVVFPTSSEDDARQLVEKLAGILGGVKGQAQVERRGTTVFLHHGFNGAGAGDVWRRRGDEKRRPAERPDLAAALRRVEDAPLAVALALGPDQRRVIAELHPTLPDKLGGHSGRELVDQWRWAALSLETAPELRARLVLGADDREGAAVVGTVWRKALDALLALAAAEDRDFPAETLARALSPKVQGAEVIVTLEPETADFSVLAEVILEPLRQARSAARRTTAMNDLKQVGLAMHNYYDRQKRLPAFASFDGEGKPLLSWRVHLLPFLGHEALYKRFRLDEPWDSEANRQLIAEMPEVYRCPSVELPPGRTVFVVPRGEETIFPGSQGIEFRDIRDGTSNTILIVETDAASAPIWTQPNDWRFDPDRPAHNLARRHNGGFLALFADGSVRHFSAKTDPNVLRALFTRNGGEPTP